MRWKMPACTVRCTIAAARCSAARYIVVVQPTWCTVRFCSASATGQGFGCPPHCSKGIGPCELFCFPLPSLSCPHPGRRRLPTMPPVPDPALHPYRQISSHTTQSSHASATAISQIVLDDRPVMNRTSTPSCRLGQKGCGEQASALECGRKGCLEEKWGDRFADRAACI